MTSADPVDAGPSDVLTERVLAVAGVERVFPPTALTARLPDLVAALATGKLEPPSRVDVSDTDGTTVVNARIATRRESDTPRTARQVADTLMESLDQAAAVSIRIRVVQIT
ncbi:hypothetical protein [Agromyces sp. NPDC049794]|uniref:hypothetical protein n=1 Tax=unclassified Agromyces TaxID=2639701 RepID=UPI0033F2FA19